MPVESQTEFAEPRPHAAKLSGHMDENPTYQALGRKCGDGVQIEVRFLVMPRNRPKITTA
jgi:hypothetical protein